MENIEYEIDISKKLLLDGASLLSVFDNLYYKKGFDKNPNFAFIHETVDHFKDSLELLKLNLEEVKTLMKINSNLKISIFSQIGKLAIELDCLESKIPQETIIVDEEIKGEKETNEDNNDNSSESDSDLSNMSKDIDEVLNEDKNITSETLNNLDVEDPLTISF